MRLGREQAVGYVEDTEIEPAAIDSVKVEATTVSEITVDQSEWVRQAPAPEPV
jgi:hypothetical protein